MRITIEPSERQEGLVFKKTVYFVHLQIEFTQQELDTIKKHKMQDRQMFPPNVDDTGFDHPIPLKFFFDKPVAFRFNRFERAHNFQADAEQAVRNLKDWLDVGASPAGGRTFEL